MFFSGVVWTFYRAQRRLTSDVNNRNLMAPDEFKNLGLEFSQNAPGKESKASASAEESNSKQNR